MKSGGPGFAPHPTRATSLERKKTKQKLPLKEPPKFTQIYVLGLKTIWQPCLRGEQPSKGN
jgi:hypothetical protein